MIVEVLIPRLMVAPNVRNPDLWAANGITERALLLRALRSRLCRAARGGILMNGFMTHLGRSMKAVTS